MKRNGKRAPGRQEIRGEGLEAGVLGEPSKARWAGEWMTKGEREMEGRLER